MTGDPLARWQDPGRWPRAGRRVHACSRCEDTGLVALERVVDDDRAPDGFRMELDVYRCSCPAGTRVHADFRPVPE